MSRYVSHPTAFLALGLATLTACVDVAPPEDDADAGATITEPSTIALDDDGRIACGKLGKVELRDAKIVQDDMVFGTEDELARVCGASTPGQLFGVGVDDSWHKWPGGVIPYRFLPHVPYSVEQRTLDAMTHWEAHTSINFVPYDADEHDHYVEVDTSNWCHSAVGRKGGAQRIWLSDGKIPDEVVGVAIAANNWVYTWYLDGSVTAGSPTDTDAHKAVYKFTLPPGRHAAQIVEMAINSEDKVYTWWSDGKVSIGTSFDLDQYQAPTGNWTVASGKTRNMVVGIGISASDTVHAFYSDGTRSMGNSQNLGATAVAIADVDVTMTSIRGVDFYSNNDLYTFYTNADGEYRRVIGTIDDQSAVEYASVKVSLPNNCGLGTTIHELGHTVGLMHEQSRCDRDTYVRVFWDEILPDKVGNFEKVCGDNENNDGDDDYRTYGAYDFQSVMHYGSWGWRKGDSPTMLRRAGLGANVTHVLDMAIASDDHVYTWWDDGTVTAGTSSELETYRSRYAFTLPGARTVANIRGIGIASDDRVYTYFSDGKVSVGTTSDLDAHVAPYTYTLAAKPGGGTYQPNDILAVAISDEDHVYVWYKNGYVSWGTSSFPGQHGPYAFSSPMDPNRDEIIGIDIANGDRIYAWYETGRASQGSSTHLSSITQYDIRGRGQLLQTYGVLSNGDIAAVEAMY